MKLLLYDPASRWSTFGAPVLRGPAGSQPALLAELSPELPIEVPVGLSFLTVKLESLELRRQVVGQPGSNPSPEFLELWGGRVPELHGVWPSLLVRVG
jgi:hypothetical protein